MNSCVLMCAHGCSWVLMGAHGCSWVLMCAHVCSCELMCAHVCSCELMCVFGKLIWLQECMVFLMELRKVPKDASKKCL